MKKSKLPKGADDANDAALWQAVMGGGDGRGNGVLSLLLPCASASKTMLTMLSYEEACSTVRNPCSRL